MRGLAFSILILAIVFNSLTAVAASEGVDLDFSLPAPQEKAACQYLGLSGTEDFIPYQVDADILVIEIFSMYCPICQREAPKVNQLYEKLKAYQEKSIRLIGIGAGNSSYETQFFKENYKIEFPLFSDDDFKIHKKVGEKGTPFFIALKPGTPEGSRIFFTHSGEIKDIDDFFERLINASE